MFGNGKTKLTVEFRNAIDHVNDPHASVAKAMYINATLQAVSEILEDQGQNIKRKKKSHPDFNIVERKKHTAKDIETHIQSIVENLNKSYEAITESTSGLALNIEVSKPKRSLFGGRKIVTLSLS